MRTRATEVRPGILLEENVVTICLFEVNQDCMQPGRAVGLDGAGSVLQVPKDENGLLSGIVFWPG